MTAFIEADDFTLPTPARIEGFTFSDLEVPNGFLGQVFWRIYVNTSDDSPGVLACSACAGLTTNINHAYNNFFDYPVYEYVTTVVIPPVDLPAGTYWLALHNGSLSSGTNRYVYWEKAAGAGARSSVLDFGPNFSGTWYSNAAPDAPTAELIFQLTGVAAPRVNTVSRVNGRPQITFTTSANRYYRVEYKDALSDSSWTAVQGFESVYSATGADILFTDPDPNLGNRRRRFYRAVLL